jgi:small-conductance mechanosensitive channel
MIRDLLTPLLLALTLGLGAVGPATAQEPSAPPAGQTAPAGAPSAPSETLDYDAWEADASRAESLIEAGTASTAFLTNLRSTLADWRSRFLAAQNANAARIETIQAQITALGPPPADGESEPAAISERRTALNRQLAEAQVPRVTATEAFNRANGLIAEIDAILADRQTRALFERDPAPINPLNWPPALTGLADLGLAVEDEIRRQIETARTSGESIWERVPLALILGVVAMFLLLRSRFIVGRWTERMQLQVESRRGRGALAFLISLLQVALPIVGLLLLGVSVVTLELLGRTGQALLESVIQAFVLIYMALWLAGRLFPANTGLTAAFNVSDDLRAPLRRAILLVAVFLGLGTIAETIAAQDVVPLASRGVFVLPVYIGMALSFLRLESLGRRHRAEVLANQDEGEVEGGFTLRLLAIFGLLVRVVVVAGPALSAVGYLNLAEALMTPTALTMGLAGVIIAVQSPIRDVYALLTGKTHEEAAQALLPVLVNLLLVVAVTPLLLLIWGMRPEQLSEVIARFFAGFQLGDTRITPAILLAVIAVFAIGMIVTRLLQGALRSTVLPRTKLDVGARNAVVSGLGYVGIALAAVIAVTTAGIDLTALGVVLGALSVGIGFGLQNVVNNFVSGIILLIERPISEGDWIEVGPTMGIVKSISVRSTTIETFDKTDVIVPNADLIAGTVTNWTRGNTVGRAVVTVGVAYGSDTRRVQDILTEIARSHPDVARFPEPGVDFLGFGADSLDFRMRCILRDINKLVAVKTELHHRIAERFAEEGIEIPFAQRDIWLRNPEALRPADARAAAPTSPDPRPETGTGQGPLIEDMD